MIRLKCSSCGGEQEMKGSGMFECPYCGSKSFMSDADFRGNEEFRKKFLEYLKAEARNRDFDYNSDSLWKCNGEDSFAMMNGKDLNIKYMFKYDYNSCLCYLSKENVVYIPDDKSEKEKFLSGINSLVFPEADSKLHRCFPKLKMEISLKDGREVLVFLRRPNFFPGEYFAPLESKHLAWVISRMENICCELKYSGIEHGCIDQTSIWINPVTHEGALFGDWRKVKPLVGNRDLADVRKTAIRIVKNSREPIELYEFLNSKPAKDAFDDFQAWDDVIEKGFGGHKFIKM